MGRGLLDLPNELLDVIFQYCEQFDSDHVGASRYATFARLVLVCRHLNTAAAPFLYARQDFKRKADIARFLYAVQEYPSLAPAVYELHVQAPTWLLSRHRTDEDEKTRYVLGLDRQRHRPLAPVLHLFTNLQTLKLEYAPEFAELFEYLSTDVDLFPYLENDRETKAWEAWNNEDGSSRFRLDALTIHVAHILPFWNAPRLKTLSLYNLVVRGRDAPSINLATKMSQLDRLNLMRSRFEAGAWQELSALRPRAVSLALCNMAWDERGIPSLEWMDLSSVRDLHYSELYWQRILHYRDKRIVWCRPDLRNFSSLKSLRIDLSDLPYIDIESDIQQSALELDNGVYTSSDEWQPRLPKSLEHLRVDIPEHDNTERAMSLSSIASRCKADTPRLKQVELHFSYHEPHDTYESHQKKIEISTDDDIRQAIAMYAYLKPHGTGFRYHSVLEGLSAGGEHHRDLRRLQRQFEAVGVKTTVWTELSVNPWSARVHHVCFM